jgi:hypothetical protein
MDARDERGNDGQAIRDEGGFRHKPVANRPTGLGFCARTC